MAYFQRTGGKVKAYYHHNGKNTLIPRAETKHLDGLTDSQIKDWLDNWETKNLTRVKARAKIIIGIDEAKLLFDNYQESKRQLRNVSEGTLRDEKSLFNKHVCPYFASTCKEKNVRKWSKYTSEICVKLKQQNNLSVKTIKQIAWLIERFGKHLASVGIIDSPWYVPAPILNKKATTPLEIELTPEVIIEAANKIKEPVWKLALLIGYFFSLRPGEVFALEKGDFLTGDKAKNSSKTYSRFSKIKLGSGLSVAITKSLKNSGIIGSPKTHHSYGYVNCFNSEGAKEIAAIVKELPTGRIFSGHKTTLFKAFSKATDGIIGVTPHDLRRASCLYLGRTIGVEVMLLQDHMRHSDLQTTLSYTRRPLEEIALEDEQDFGDVS